MLDIKIVCDKCKKPMDTEKFFVIAKQGRDGFPRMLACICPWCLKDSYEEIYTENKKEGGATE